jgi:hypothetical protein
MRNIFGGKCILLRLMILFFCISYQFLSVPQVSALNADQIEYMDYLMEFKYKNTNEKIHFKTRIQLEINHTGFEFPGNGTIKYTIENPMLDIRLLYIISQVLPPEFAEYFSDPESAEYLLTYYHNRTESPDPNFNTSNSYTIFWMHEDLEYITNFISFGRVYFFNTSNPFSLAIDNIGTISHGTKRWSETFAGRFFDFHTSICFILSLDIIIGEDETYFHMYYDRATGMLMYAKFYMKEFTETGKIFSQLEIHHVSSTFPVSERFNWWILLTITFFSGIGATFSWISYVLIGNRNRKKPSRLDEI